VTLVAHTSLVRAALLTTGPMRTRHSS
jgi:hypothetical protein